MLTAGEIRSMRTTLDELTNATLTAIETPADLDEYGDPGGTTSAWTGRADGFLEILDHQETVGAHQANGAIAGGRQTSIQLTTFRLLDDAGAPIIEQAGPDWSGTTVLIEDRRLTTPVTLRFSVVGMEHEANGLLDSILLTLDNETAT